MFGPLPLPTNCPSLGKSVWPPPLAGLMQQIHLPPPSPRPPVCSPHGNQMRARSPPTAPSHSELKANIRMFQRPSLIGPSIFLPFSPSILFLTHSVPLASWLFLLDSYTPTSPPP